MGLETGVTYIDDLVETNPIGSTDTLDEADNHLRIIKVAVKGSFPSLGSAAVTKTAAEINNLAEKSVPATTNNLAMLDAGGDLADSLVETDGAGNITANVTGNADTATLAATVTLNADLSGDVTSSGSNVTSLADDTVTFADEIVKPSESSPTYYDFTYTNSNKTEVVPVGIYTRAQAISSGGNVNGTVELQYYIDGVWRTVETITVTTSSGNMVETLVISDGVNCRLVWTYTSGGTSSDYWRFTKLF